jgi:hypothetical protein
MPHTDGGGGLHDPHAHNQLLADQGGGLVAVAVPVPPAAAALCFRCFGSR